MRRIALKAYAKINLGLKILGRRDDGYHELRTVYQSISLADRVEVGLDSRMGEVRLEATGFSVPAGRENLAVRAAEAALQELGLRRRVLISLQKRIPPGSGLGGASSDAAAVLRALVRLSGKRIPSHRLLHLAAELGSDVPFFLIGGRCLGVGRGEEVYPLAEVPRQTVVALFPGEGVSTAEAYRLLQAPRLTAVLARPTIELFGGAAMGDGARLPDNDFESLILPRFPQLAEAKRIMQRSGARVAALSGSGSALFGLFADRGRAQRAALRIRQLGSQVFLARTISRREFQAQLALAELSC
jgi:4-diphosphocytidyl-2-C-methyl-D-erythritol kinase